MDDPGIEPDGGCCDGIDGAEFGAGMEGMALPVFPVLLPVEEPSEPAGIVVSVILSVGWISIFWALSQASWDALLVFCACAAAKGVANKAETNSIL